MILTVSGSARPGSSNESLLRALAQLHPEQSYQHYEHLGDLPLFIADRPPNERVEEWKARVRASDAVIFCTPEYLHNLPAALKNALEWLTTGGELANKPVVVLTATPHPPRGTRAMQSLLWTLEALNARVLTQLDVYDVARKINADFTITDPELKEMLLALVELLEH